MRVTLKDIAERANVNFTLVSKYINKTPGVRIRPEKQVRIQKAIEELNYRPIAAARVLRYGKSDTIGLIVGNLTNEYFAHYADEAMNVVEKLGYRLLISVCRGTSPEKEIQVLESNQVDGIICCDCFNPQKASCPMLPEQSFSIDAVKKAMRKAEQYLKRNNCHTMAGLFTDHRWPDIFSVAENQRLTVSSYPVPLPIDQRLEFLRKVCSQKPDAIFSTGWQTATLLSSVLDQDFPGYEPVILSWANCKGPFMKNPRLKGVILTSTLQSIMDTVSALAAQIQGKEQPTYSGHGTEHFVTRGTPEFAALEAEVFSLT